MVALVGSGRSPRAAAAAEPRRRRSSATLDDDHHDREAGPDGAAHRPARPDGVVANALASLGVKIENTPEAAPAVGPRQADVVYEEVVEGGITRFWAIFNSTAPENVGPIRSVRSMDPNIVLPLGGVVAFSGGTEPTTSRSSARRAS